MPQVPFESRTVNHRALAGFCKRLFLAAGLDGDDAGLVVDTLVESDLRGIGSHGVARIPHYASSSAGSIPGRTSPPRFSARLRRASTGTTDWAN